MANEKNRELRIKMMEILYNYDLLGEFKLLTPAENDPYVVEIVNYIGNNMAKIDELIKSSLVRYTIDRINYVDRAIIRISVAEMLNGLPKAIAINEALEIVKAYSDVGDKKDVHFINKLLDTISSKI